MSWEVRQGDCIEQMRGFEADSIDAIVTDPPYALSFMGKAWDTAGVAFDPATWTEALRVLKPGGHLLAFGGTRTYHRLTCAIEDAGFEVRDCLAWLYGSGFPKSLDVSKAIDKAAGAEREVVGTRRQRANSPDSGVPMNASVAEVEPITAPATPEAAQWQGWGTALKPAWESIIWAQKPSGEADTIRRSLWLLTEQLRSLASDAESDSSSRPAALDEAFASAGWTVDERRNTRAALREAMGTSQFESALTTSLSIVSSWSDTLDGLCELTSTFTTETASGTTTALRTLKSCLSDLTPRTMLQAATNPDGSAWSALPAASAFSAVELRLSATRELLAPEPATSESPALSQGGVAPNGEPIVLARKPLAGTVAGNCLAYGTGALNVDGCRVGFEGAAFDGTGLGRREEPVVGNPAGRWPANVILDPEAAALLDEQSGTLTSGANPTRRRSDKFRTAYGDFEGESECIPARGADSGGASRFFYCAKASRAERNAGLDHLPIAGRTDDGYGSIQTPNGEARSTPRENWNPREVRNPHPTVKPIELMRWLVRLVTPPGGTVLDPFCGSGSTGCAAVLEDFDFVGIEREAEYVALAEARISHWAAQPKQLALGEAS